VRPWPFARRRTSFRRQLVRQRGRAWFRKLGQTKAFRASEIGRHTLIHAVAGKCSWRHTWDLPVGGLRLTFETRARHRGRRASHGNGLHEAGGLGLGSAVPSDWWTNRLAPVWAWARRDGDAMDLTRRRVTLCAGRCPSRHNRRFEVEGSQRGSLSTQSVNPTSAALRSLSRGSDHIARTQGVRDPPRRTTMDNHC